MSFTKLPLAIAFGLALSTAACAPEEPEGDAGDSAAAVSNDQTNRVAESPPDLREADGEQKVAAFMTILQRELREHAKDGVTVQLQWAKSARIERHASLTNLVASMTVRQAGEPEIRCSRLTVTKWETEGAPKGLANKTVLLCTSDLRKHDEINALFPRRGRFSYFEMPFMDLED